MFCEAELVNRKKSFYKNVRVGNLNPDVIMRNSICTSRIPNLIITSKENKKREISIDNWSK